MKFAIVDTGKNAINVYMYLKDKYSVVQTYVGFDLNRVRQHTHNAMEKNDISTAPRAANNVDQKRRAGGTGKTKGFSETAGRTEI